MTINNDEIYDKLDEELANTEDPKLARRREARREYYQRNKEKIAEYAKRYRERLKKENPEKLREMDRLSMRKQRRTNGDNLRAYQCEYMKKYRKNVQGMTAHTEKRSRKYIEEQIEKFVQLMKENAVNVPWKGLYKDKEHKRLYARLKYWKDLYRITTGEDYVCEMSMIKTSEPEANTPEEKKRKYMRDYMRKRRLRKPDAI